MADERSVKAFLLENVESPIVKEKYKIDRFGEPFEIKSLTAEETDELRKQATRITLNRKTNTRQQETDQNRFSDLVMVHAITFPNLNNKELQESYGCLGEPAKLLKTMLKVGEFSDLSNKVMEVCGINQDDAEELKDEAKN